MQSKLAEVESMRFPASQNIPNHPELPALIYWQALDPDAPDGGSPAKVFAARFRDHGWAGIWCWSVFDFHHYHSNAHEVLGIASGEARLQLGGPDGSTVSVRAGDVVLLPAGTGHKKLEASSDFQVVGAYPKGQENKDLICNDQGINESIRERIRSTARPQQDPVYGEAGSMQEHWH